MAANHSKLAEDIKSLSDVEKLELVDSILAELDRPNPEIERIWAEEATKRWKKYTAGNLEFVSYKQVMEKHKRK